MNHIDKIDAELSHQEEEHIYSARDGYRNINKSIELTVGYSLDSCNIKIDGEELKNKRAASFQLVCHVNHNPKVIVVSYVTKNGIIVQDDNTCELFVIEEIYETIKLIINGVVIYDKNFEKSVDKNTEVKK